METMLEPQPSLREGSRQLFATLQRMAIERLGIALEAVMHRSDDYLFDRTGHGVEAAELTALRELRRARTRIQQSFEQALITGFMHLRGDAAESPPASVELSLLSEEALEEQLAVEQIVDNLSRRHATAVELLEQRLAALVQRTALLPGENPAGPVFLAQAMRDAVHVVDLSTALRIALYKFMEREFSSALTPLYDRMNASLADAGILPRLLPTVTVDPQQVDAANVDDRCVDVTSATSTTAGAGDHVLFSSLVSLLQSWRQHVAPASSAGDRGNVQQLRAPELMSVLTLLQTAPPEAFDQALGNNRLSLAALLRNEVLAGARRLGIGSDNLNLSSIQEDAVDLVGMLFDVLLDERDFEPDVRRKISRMLVPYVKVAVNDRRMFLYKGHPARRFLNAIAEACEGNHGDAPQERELLERVDVAIDRLVAEFNEDVAIFETLEQELRAFMAQHRQRIEIAERRAAETQRGRERLEQARARASADIASMCGARRLPPVLEDYLSRYALHHLTQVVLRGGGDSGLYPKSLNKLQEMLDVFEQAQCRAAVPHPPSLDRLGMAEILSSSGCVGAAADEAIDMLQRSLGQLAADGAMHVQTDRLPEREIAAEPVRAGPLLEIVGGHALLDFDPVVAERMRALDVGTWVQLTGENGRTEPAKVSWISPISARFLFVNRRGARILVVSAEELAAMAKLGRVQLRQAETAFDDALHQVMGRLRSRTAVA